MCYYLRQMSKNRISKSSNPWITCTLYLLAVIASAGVLFGVILPFINSSGDIPEVEEAYLNALDAERDWVQSENPGGDGGVSPVLAKKEFDIALKALQDAVKALPEGERLSWRVSSYISNYPTYNLMIEEEGGK